MVYNTWKALLNVMSEFTDDERTRNSQGGNMQITLMECAFAHLVVLKAELVTFYHNRCKSYTSDDLR